jgi:hypothetical protein
MNTNTTPFWETNCNLLAKEIAKGEDNLKNFLQWDFIKTHYVSHT